MGRRTADGAEDCAGGAGGAGGAALLLARRLRDALLRGRPGPVPAGRWRRCCGPGPAPPLPTPPPPRADPEARARREVAALLRLGADPNLVLPDGAAAVHLAAGSARESGPRCLALLLRRGADPNARSEDALTPVHVAACWGRHQSLKLLLQEGGDPELRDQDGKRALDLALEQGDEECVQILRGHASSDRPCRPAPGRGEDGGRAPTGGDLDTGIWELSHKTDRQRSPDHTGRAHLEGGEVQSEASATGPTLPRQALPAHPQPSPGKGVGLDKLPESDSSFPAPLFAQPTSSPSSAPRLVSEPHLGPDAVSPDQDSVFHPDPGHSCEDQDETVPSSLSADTGTSSSDSFWTAVEAFDSDAQASNTIPSSPITPEAPEAVPSWPRKSRSESQSDSTAGTSSIQTEPLDRYSLDSRAPQTPGHPRKNLAYAALRTELRAMIRNTGYSQTVLDESDMLPPSMDPVSQLNSQLRGLVLGSPPESQDLTITSRKLQGLVSHNGEGSSSPLSDKSMEQDPSLKLPLGRSGPDSVNNECSREGKYPNLENLEEAGTVPLLVAFSEDDPFNDFLTNNRTSQSSEDGVSRWLAEDGEDEEDHLSQGTRVSSCWNGLRKPPEPHRACPIMQPPGLKPPEPRHTDPKAGSSFNDQHLLHAENSGMDGQHNYNPSAPSPLRDPFTLSNQELMQHLPSLGETPDPVTPFTRQYYLKRLQERSPGGQAAPARYSSELTLVLQTGCIPNAQDDEDALAQQFDRPDPTQRWHEGIVKSSFTYLLLDPRVTQNLPSRCHILSPAECFQTFIHAIFYVGKGTRTRPYSHLSEALHHQQNRQKQTCPKVQRILDIWGSGRGVVSLHCFQNVIAVEAYTREACLVDALGTQVLSNQKKGHYYGLVAHWPPHRRRRLGVHLLHRALGIFLAEGERQLRPPDIQVGT
ncbi:ankyrin repeat and LEM domain-containing protein 1 [Macrotis lagotis]|uniref:ankyrin repeat and LEM domain-containing protein 1 n=1 Tax=Macrotis lagotis TaxID=92651 RepID=UPI003D692481